MVTFLGIVTILGMVTVLRMATIIGRMTNDHPRMVTIIGILTILEMVAVLGFFTILWVGILIFGSIESQVSTKNQIEQSVSFYVCLYGSLSCLRS